MRLGFFTFILLYAFFLCVMDAAVWFMPAIAFLVSWAGGYYWMGYSIKVPLYTTDENRDVSLSVIGMGTGIVNLMMPTVTGGIISACEGVMENGLLGYYIMFALSIAVALVTVSYLKKLPADQVAFSQGQLNKRLSQNIPQSADAGNSQRRMFKRNSGGNARFLFEHPVV